MKIVFIGPRSIPARYGGIDTHTEKVADYLVQQKGHEIIVYARRYYSGLQGGLYKGIKVRMLPTFPNKYLDTMLYALAATFLAVLEKPDIIHYQGGSAFFAFIPYCCGCKVVCTIQASEWQREKWGTIVKFLLKIIETMSFQYSHRFITVSKILEQSFNARYPHNRKVTYIPNGVEPTSSLPPREILNYGLTADRYILFVGRLVPEKGLHYLIEAYRKLNCDLKLVIAGGAPHVDAYAANLQKMASRDIIFTGFIKGDPLTELYSNAYVYVHPSALEGLSMSLLEAMSFGKCVLVSDIPENKEVVGNYGIYFRNKNAEDLTHKLKFLIEHRDTVKQSGTEIRKYVLDNYAWQKIVDQIDKVYRTLYNKGKRVVR